MWNKTQYIVNSNTGINSVFHVLPTVDLLAHPIYVGFIAVHGFTHLLGAQGMPHRKGETTVLIVSGH